MPPFRVRAGGLVKREKLEMSGGMSDLGCWHPAEPQPQPWRGWGEEGRICHSFICTNLVPITKVK